MTGLGPDADLSVVLLVARTDAWRRQTAAHFNHPNVRLAFMDIADGSGMAADSPQGIDLAVVETGNDDVFFGSVVRQLDPGFLSAGGPVIAVADTSQAADDEVFFALGATRVIASDATPAVFRRVVAGEISEFGRLKKLRADLAKRSSAIGEVVQGRFRLRTRREAQNLATMLSLASTQPTSVAVGLTELMINGIEHGCLGIGHEDKGRLLESGELGAEILRRRAMPDYTARYIEVEYENRGHSLVFTVTDPGEGFDYSEFSGLADGHAKKHGRGILMARGCFDELDYLGKGNVVRVVHSLTRA